MIKFSQEKVLLHQLLIQETGGADHIVGLHKGILPFSCSILFVSCLKMLSDCSGLFVSLSTL